MSRADWTWNLHSFAGRMLSIRTVLVGFGVLRGLPSILIRFFTGVSTSSIVLEWLSGVLGASSGSRRNVFWLDRSDELGIVPLTLVKLVIHGMEDLNWYE